MIEASFGKSAYQVLSECVQKGMTYLEAEGYLQFKACTIRKWANRFGLQLRPVAHMSRYRGKMLKAMQAKEINGQNFLYRSW